MNKTPSPPPTKKPINNNSPHTTNTLYPICLLTPPKCLSLVYKTKINRLIEK